MRSLNLDQLRTFVEVVSQGNFSAAGRQLNLTQPAVSLHVRELEQRFGVRLVERVGRRAYRRRPAETWRSTPVAFSTTAKTSSR